MIHANEFDYVYANMSEGQKQHMANRLYKRDGIYAQRLDTRLEQGMPKPGDVFERVSDDLYQGHKYILAAFGGNKAALVNLRDGNVWRLPSDPINGHYMTQEDWKSVCGDPQKWKKVPK
jgi:hypothetical protein